MEIRLAGTDEDGKACTRTREAKLPTGSLEIPPELQRWVLVPGNDEECETIQSRFDIFWLHERQLFDLLNASTPKRDPSRFLSSWSESGSVLAQLVGNDPVVIDIDEDYFAQIRGVDTVYRSVGSKVSTLRKALEALCPDPVPLTAYESELSLALMLLVTSSSCEPRSRCGQRALDEVRRRFELLPVRPCETAGTVSSVLANIQRSLHAATLTPASREMLGMHGFCVTTGHITWGTETPRNVKLCSEGDDDDEASDDTDNTPEVVALAVEPAAMGRRLASFTPSLKAVVRSLGKGIVGATVCRSVRDGYTPKHSWRQIEDGVLAALRSEGFAPSFGIDLLGGRGGWSNWTDVHVASMEAAAAAAAEFQKLGTKRYR